MSTLLPPPAKYSVLALYQTHHTSPGGLRLPLWVPNTWSLRDALSTLGDHVGPPPSYRSILLGDLIHWSTCSMTPRLLGGRPSVLDPTAVALTPCQRYQLLDPRSASSNQWHLAVQLLNTTPLPIAAHSLPYPTARPVPLLGLYPRLSGEIDDDRRAMSQLATSRSSTLTGLTTDGEVIALMDGRFEVRLVVSAEQMREAHPITLPTPPDSL